MLKITKLKGINNCRNTLTMLKIGYNTIKSGYINTRNGN